MGKADEAYNWIKEQIICGNLAPLVDISEDDIQARLNVSRTPVREALLRLERDGMVKVYPRKGTIVTDVTRDLVEEVYEMREMIEPAVAASAIPNIDRGWLLEMRERLLHPPEGLDDEALRLYYIELDDVLHTAIIEASTNRFLKQALKVVYDQNRRLRYATSHPTSEADHSIQEHIAIIDALLAKDRDRVIQVSLEHLKKSEVRTDRSYR